MQRNSSMRVLGLIAAFFALGFHAAANAATVTIDFSSLPSTQGWTYANFPPNFPQPEGSVFSVSGGQLHQNTVGFATGITGTNRYNYSGIVDPGLSFTLEVRARLLAEEQGLGGSNNHYGFAFGVFTGTNAFGMGLGSSFFSTQDTFGANQSYPGSFDPSLFHDYKMVGTPGVGYSIFIDNVFVLSGLPQVSAAANALFLGDATGGVNAQADISYYRFEQSPVPVPAALPLFASGLGLLAWVARRRQKQTAQL